jgi:arginyl-tRNA synthetase
MLGADGKPFKTRTGGTVKLAELLGEAVERAYALVSQKNPELPEPQRREIARIVAIGAVKYADLAQNRSSDYMFSFDKMLSLEGNTAPYMQYAYARIKSIFRKAAEFQTHEPAAISLAEPAERALAIKLLQFHEALEVVAAECLPNVLCGYLYDLAGAFMSFYESCPVLKAEPEVRSSRLALCKLTADVIKRGLGLLGIETIEQM